MDTRTKGIWMILVGGSLWGASGTAVQYLFETKHLTPEWLLMMRMMVTGILMLGYEFFRGGNLWALWQHPKHRFAIINFAVFGMICCQYFYFLAIKYGNAATATVLQYLMPVLVLLYSLWQWRRRPQQVEVISVGLAMLGTYLLITKGNWNALAISEETLFYGVLSAFAMAFYTIYPQEMLNYYSSTMVIGWGMLISGVLMNIFLSPWPFTGIFDWQTVLGMSVLIIFGTFIAFYCYLESTKYIKASEVGALASVEPLASVVLAMLFLHISFGPAELLGIACIIGTVFILARQK
ncbi:MAG: DMT family transporter [Acidaminococcaceae bacterium]